VLTCAHARIVGLLAAIPSLVLAQRYSFKQYGQDQGLTNLDVFSMMQDRTGFLWVATDGGVYRYDGREFRAYTTAQGLPSAQVIALHQTADGVIWVATSAGLARLAGDFFEKVPIESRGATSVTSDARGTLYAGSALGLWVAAPAGPSGRREFRLYTNPGQSQQGVSGMALDSAGRLWYGCGYGICVFESGRVSAAPASGVPHAIWRGLSFDRKGNLWARSIRQLIELPRGASQFQKRDADLPLGGRNPSVNLDRDGEIYVPTGQGLARRTGDGWTMIRRANGLPASAVEYFFQDREGSAWIAVDGCGLVRWLGYKNWETWTESEGLTHDVVWALTRDNRGTLWAATQAGVSSLPRGASHWEALPHPPLNLSRNVAMVAAPDGTLWIGQSPGGVVHLDPRSGRTEQFGAAAGVANEWVYSLAVDSQGRLWAGTGSGLFVGCRSQGRFRFEPVDVPFSTSSRSIFLVMEDSAGRLWAATSGGLCYREKAGWQTLSVQDGLRHNIVNYVAEAPDRALWIGYRDPIGVSRITLDGGRVSARHFDAQAGVRAAKPYFLRFDRRGWLWLGTDMGIQRYDGRTWVHYDKADGLALNDCDHNAFFEDDDGSVWIGTPRGLSHLLNPAAAGRPLSVPALITRLQLGATPAALEGDISVPFARRSLDARFAALTFVGEDTVRFRHRLLGLDDTWLETRQAEAHYPGLRPGSYQLQVQAAVEGGVWSGSPAAAAFTIQPPWWRRWWSESAALLLLGLAVRQIWRWRVRAILSRQQELESAVADRTQKLALEHRCALEEKACAEQEKAMVEKQKVEIERLLLESRQAERVKTEFVANMSHEVRTPLNGIVGLADILLDSGITADQAECLRMVKISSDSLLALINSVLDFSKIEAGRFTLDTVEFDLRRLIQDTLKSLEGLARPKNLQLGSRMAANLPERLLGDPARLRQVLINLVGNAIKFTETGSVEVLAETQTMAENEAFLHIQVRDTGIGVPPEQQSLIFEPFRQADGSTSRRFGGTGLGLAISARLISLMGGRIWMNSIPGAGSTFHFTARFGIATEHSGRPAAKSDLHLAVPSGLHILLVEDNPINQKVARRILESRGTRVTCASDGREALAICESNKFDLILMDIQMPVLDGNQAAREIRDIEKERGGHTPILACTASAMQEDIDLCLASGMDGHISKPIRITELIVAAERVLGKSVVDTPSQTA